ncbi:hypothetical protein ONS95_007085 [Cadophora gregata]|uniref:uncharacterized protein n=1 Tax=Cadophora gregata TaxID=51156 RepID=UPI0026DCE030|nr:uncharacterized protein ONS95_007085 [Cadophora gregata]KAK0100630.1 hypothetical protein ONS95_007085 [Cadophora gregata]KAK0117370.1 hypothetical protein ONS96_013200 [Cadophora gregata f. sp. sojae]
MHTTLFTLPLPVILFLTTALALPAPIPAPATPSILESYLDFNAIPANAELIPHSALTKRNLNLNSNSQAPLTPSLSSSSTKNPPPKKSCPPPHLDPSEITTLVSSLTAEMLSKHSHGIGFPYSTDTHCSGSVELTARSPVVRKVERASGDGISNGDEGGSGKGEFQFNAKLKILLTPMGSDNYGMKRAHFASLLKRVAGAGLGFEFVGGGEDSKLETEGEGGQGKRERDGLVVWDEGEGEKDGRRGVLEGVSGDVGFVARLVVSPVLGGGCLA